MTDAGMPDDPTGIEEERERWDQDQSVRDRVYETAIQLYEPATVAHISERARCSAGAAREHLEWFANRGIVTIIDGRPKRYKRNQAYFDWKRSNDLRQEYSDTELQERVEELTAAARSYRETYGVNSPSAVDAFEYADYDTVHEVWEDLSDWKTVRRELRLLDRARREPEPLPTRPT